MLELSNLIIEFDTHPQIAHLTGSEKVSIETEQDADILYNMIFEKLKKYHIQPVYFVTDLSKIRLDPILTEFCIEKSREFFSTHIYPGGIARYGYELSRVALLRAHRDFQQPEPNIFNSRFEAFAYIYGMIRKQAIADKECPANAI